MSELPDGWVATTLGDLGRWSSGGTPSKRKSKYYGGDIPWVRTGDLRDNEIFDVEGRISSEGLANSSAKEFPSGTLLVAMYGATIGRTGMLRIPATTNQACAALLPDPVTEDMMPFLWWFFRHKVEDFRAVGQGGAQPNISQTVIKASAIDLLPLPEQRRIVAKLDRLSARSAAARDHLARTTKLATRAKQAILEAAFSGRLTEDWREAHEHSLEETIVGDIARVSSGYGFPKKFQGKSQGRFPFAKVSDLSVAFRTNRGRLATAANYVDDVDLAAMRARPVPAGSTAFAKIGEALKLNRRALLEQDAILDNNCMALSPDETRISREFLFLFMHTVDLAPFSVATTVPSVRRGNVENLPILLPEPEEQAEIVRRIEAAFTRIDRITEEASRAAHLLDRLDERLLAKPSAESSSPGPATTNPPKPSSLASAKPAPPRRRRSGDAGWSRRNDDRVSKRPKHRGKSLGVPHHGDALPAPASLRCYRLE